MSPFQTRGGSSRWCTRLTTPTLHSQRAKPSPLWCSLCLGIRVGSGLARIPRVLCDKTERGGAPRVPASPGAAARRTRGVLVEGATPSFLPLVRHRGVFTGAYSGARSTLPVGGRSLHSDPWREGGQIGSDARRDGSHHQRPAPCRATRPTRPLTPAPSLSLLAPSRPPSWEREKGAAGVMGGPGESSPGRGSKGPEPLASPNVLHWVGWLPGTTRCGAGPAVPVSHGAPARHSGAPHESGAGGGTCGP